MSELPENYEELVADFEAERLVKHEAEVAKQKTQNAILAAIYETAITQHTEGGGWVQPTGAHNAYMRDISITHEGKVWESLLDFNVWEPGKSGWREKVAQGYPAWVQPTGAHDAYSKDDKVSHNGKNWNNYHPGVRTNSWAPGVYGWIVIP